MRRTLFSSPKQGRGPVVKAHSSHRKQWSKPPFKKSLTPFGTRQGGAVACTARRPVSRLRSFHCANFWTCTHQRTSTKTWSATTSTNRRLSSVATRLHGASAVPTPCVNQPASTTTGADQRWHQRDTVVSTHLCLWVGSLCNWVTARRLPEQLFGGPQGR